MIWIQNLKQKSLISLYKDNILKPELILRETVQLFYLMNFYKLQLLDFENISIL